MKKLFLSILGLAVAAMAYAVTPADPTNVSWYDSEDESGYSRLTFTLPTVDVNGNPLDIEMMGYRIYTDDDQIFTFNSAVYDNVWGSTTEIYYYNWETGSDIQSTVVYFYRTNADGYDRFFNHRIGIQVFYLNDNFSIGGVSNIVYDVVFPQGTLPKPATPMLDEFIDYGLPVGVNVAYTIPHTWMTNPQLPVADDYTMEKEFDEDSPEYGNFTTLDPEKVSFSLFTDNGKIFTFTPELFPGQVTEPITQFPYNSRTPNGSIGYSDMHIELSNLVDEGEEPFFTWRIGIQTYYTDGGQTSASDLLYMEVYPQLKEAQEVTGTSFLADWSCDAEDTYILAGFQSYELYVIDKATQEVVMVQNVEPTNMNEDGDYLPGAFFTVEGLTPRTTYQYYVVCSDSYNSFNSVVREVTLPCSCGFYLGDVNHDGQVSIADVTALIDYLLGNTEAGCALCADVNEDSNVTIADVTTLIDTLLAH